MSILVDENTKVIVQGITGNQGSFHTKLMLDYHTRIVAGVTPGKAGQSIHGVPVYNTVRDALQEHPADYSIIFVPARFAKDAALEALENSLNVVLITENIPVHDVIEVVRKAQEKKLVVIGPNCPGIISPGKSKVGIIPAHICKKGNIGIVSRSGTLTYEIIKALTSRGIGQSTVIGIGGDMILGTDFISVLKMFENDPETRAVVLIGEIGGDMEERAAEFIRNNIRKKVVAYIAGRTAPADKRMGHAGAIISGKSGSAESKIRAFESARVPVAELPSDIVRLIC